MTAAGPSPTHVVELAETFRLLGDPTRLGIVMACLDSPRAVGELAESLAQSPSLVSHHLRLLRAARLLRAERRGRNVYYGISDAHVSGMLRDMAAHVAESDEEHDP